MQTNKFEKLGYGAKLNFDIRSNMKVCKFIYTLRDVDGILVPIKTIQLGAEMSILEHLTGDFLQKKSHQKEFIYVHDFQALFDTSKLTNLWLEFQLYNEFLYKFPLTASVDQNFIKTIKWRESVNAKIAA